MICGTVFLYFSYCIFLLGFCYCNSAFLLLQFRHWLSATALLLENICCYVMNLMVTCQRSQLVTKCAVQPTGTVVAESESRGLYSQVVQMY
jgi:hypothetical protein